MDEKELLRRNRIGETLKRKYKSGELTYKPPMSGKKHSVETLEKMRKSAKKRVALGIAIPHPHFGSKHHNWKGGVSLYESTHNWIKRNFGKANCCERCDGKNSKFEWSNISGEYKKERTDWMMLCVSCHRKEDAINPKHPKNIFPNNKRLISYE